MLKSGKVEDGNGKVTVTLEDDKFELILDSQGGLECWIYLGDEGKSKLWANESHNLILEHLYSLREVLTLAIETKVFDT